MSNFKINVYEKNNNFKNYSLIICKRNWYYPFLAKFTKKVNYEDALLSISALDNKCDFYEYKNPYLITNVFEKDLKKFFSRIKFIKKYKYKNININNLLENIIKNTKNSIYLELYFNNQNPYLLENIKKKYFEYINKIYIKYTINANLENLNLESFLLQNSFQKAPNPINLINLIYPSRNLLFVKNKPLSIFLKKQNSELNLNKNYINELKEINKKQTEKIKKNKNALEELEKSNDELEKSNLSYSSRVKKFKKELEEMEKLNEKLNEKYEMNSEELEELKKQFKFYDI